MKSKMLSEELVAIENSEVDDVSVAFTVPDEAASVSGKKKSKRQSTPKA
jgi:hypothetical protein